MLWPGRVNNKGYGMRWVPQRKREQLAHRVAWEETYGPVPPGMYVLHRCDNPRCVNPEHLWLGTQADNLRDCAEKGRTSRGEASPNAKLTDDQVRTIRREFETLAPRFPGRWARYRILADRFDVDPHLIGLISRGKRWRHVREMAKP